MLKAICKQVVAAIPETRLAIYIDLISILRDTARTYEMCGNAIFNSMQLALSVVV
jgi:hypothetical protein